MIKGCLASFVFLLVCLNANGTVWGDDEPLSAPGVAVAENSTTERELLAFYEEQDLYTATRRATTLRKAPAIATIITADEIRNMGARNLLDVLKMVPGFGVSINEFGSFMVEVRGIRTSLSEKILVMIDGHSLNKNINGSAIIYNLAGMLPVENIKQVEVVRGPGSALYGNSAFVATINVITRDAEEIDGLEAKGGGGSFDTYKGNLTGGKAVGDRLTTSASVDHYRTRGARLTVDADSLTGTPFSMAPGTPDLGMEQTDTFLKLGYGELSLRGGYKVLKEGLFIGLTSTLTDGNQPEFTTAWGELGYDLRLAEGLASNLKLRYDYYDQTGTEKLFPNGFLGGFPAGVLGEPLVKDQTFGGEVQVDWDPFSGNHLIAGGSYEAMQQYDVRQFANFVLDPATHFPVELGAFQGVPNWNKDVTRQTWALYLQDEWQLPEQVNLTAGVRYDHYSDFGGTVNPRAGLVWSFLDNADLKLLYGQAFRAPNFVELYNINNPVAQGNPNLDPERIRTYEASLAYRLNRFLAGDLTYFYSTIKDLIRLQNGNFVNTGKLRTQGIEAGLNGALDGDFSWRLTYAFQDPKDANIDQRLPDVPSQRATVSVNYMPVKYLNLHSDVIWTGPRPRTQGDSRAEMPSYATVDLAVTLKNFFETLEIQAAVHNLFDERFRDPDTSDAQHLVLHDFPREGISALVTASYKF